MSRKITDFRRRLPARATWTKIKQAPIQNHFITPPNQKKCEFWSCQAPFFISVESRMSRRLHAALSPRRSPGSWSPGFALSGSCVSSRLDHGLEVRLREPRNSLKFQFLEAQTANKYSKMQKRRGKREKLTALIFHVTSRHVRRLSTASQQRNNITQDLLTNSIKRNTKNSSQAQVRTSLLASILP